MQRNALYLGWLVKRPAAQAVCIATPYASELPGTPSSIPDSHNSRGSVRHIRSSSNITHQYEYMRIIYCRIYIYTYMFNTFTLILKHINKNSFKHTPFRGTGTFPRGPTFPRVSPPHPRCPKRTLWKFAERIRPGGLGPGNRAVFF